MPVLTDRQKNIIDAATKLLSERGIQELTLKNLAARVGVSEPALYRHFASKADILKGVLDLFEDQIHSAILPTAEISAKSDSDKEVGTTLKHFVSGIAAILIHRPELAALLFSEEVFWNEPELSERMHALMTRTLYRISALIASGINSGEFRPDIDPASFSTALIGGIRLLCTVWRLGSFSTDLAKDVDKLWGTLRTSITTFPVIEKQSSP